MQEDALLHNIGVDIPCKEGKSPLFGMGLPTLYVQTAEDTMKTCRMFRLIAASRNLASRCVVLLAWAFLFPAQAQTANSIWLTNTAQGTQMLLSWPATGTSYELQQSDRLDAPDWTLVGPYVVATQGQYAAAVPTDLGSRFFRLRAFPVYYGKTLAQWQEAYWRWAYGETAVPTDTNGNAVLSGVVLMALPQAPGDGTPGSTNLTLTAAQPFVLPLWNLIDSDYTDPSNDAFIDMKVFRTLDLDLTLDGVTLIGSTNLMQYFTQFHFAPGIPLNASARYVVWLQGIGIVHGPLPAGDHIIHLDAKNTDTADLFGLVFEYHNTWNLSVRP